MNEDERYMSRCLELARRGGRDTGTNPMVGCVIVCDGKVIGEGWHRRFGEAHAEVNALRSVSPADESCLRRSTLYVNLEPCSHYGKTPPCCDAVIAREIPRVVVGMRDPFPKVDGSGIARLRGAGTEVVTGVSEDECRHLNRRFVVYHREKRPYIIFKWAQTIDGFIDSARDASQPPVWLTNESCRRLVHRWRSEESAIFVGSRTVLRDDPALTNRLWSGDSPLRLTIDRKRSIASAARMLDGSVPTVVFTDAAVECPVAAGAVRYVPIDFSQPGFVDRIFGYLYETGVLSVFVEGGTTLFDLLSARGCPDEARIFVSPRMLGELPGGQCGTGVKAPCLRAGKAEKTENIDGVMLKTVFYGA